VKKQRGVALITAILVVAIATLAATALLSASEAAILRTGNLRDSEQAWWYAQGVESWVLGILRQDGHDTKYDGLDEAWATPVTALPVDEGTACGQIVDQQGLFNLNNLAVTNTKVDYGAIFRRLLAELHDVEVPPELPNAVRGWTGVSQAGMSSDSEDLFYLGLTPPYRAAHRPFTSVSELMAVQGMTPKLYRALAPFVTALPAKNATPVNVNTAPLEVLLALGGNNPAKLTQFVERRLKSPVKDPMELYNDGTLDASVDKATVSATTQYFVLQGNVFVGSGHVALYSLIFRPGPGTPLVLSRSTVPELPGTPPCATPSTSN
jgi:general secretion pathway protein K